MLAQIFDVADKIFDYIIIGGGVSALSGSIFTIYTDF